MFLKHLRIQNLRSLENIEIDFTDIQGNRKWTLIAGENGTGKSSILKAIALALSGSNAFPKLADGMDTWIRNGESSAKIEITITTKTGKERDISLVLKRDSNLREFLHSNNEGLSKIDDAIEKADQNYFIAAYGPYRYSVSKNENVMSSSNSSSPRADSVRSLFNKVTPLNSLTDWAVNQHYVDGEEGLEVVREAVSKLLPDISLVEVDKKRKELIFETVDGMVSFNQLSDGYQNMATWIGDLLSRITSAFSHYENPLHARGLILIDEIDAHLHPGWRRRLRDFIDKTLPNFQLVATTHSAMTLQQSAEDEVFLLSRNTNNRVELNSFPGDPSKLRLYQINDLAFNIRSSNSFEYEQKRELLETELLDETVNSKLSAADRELLGAKQTLLGSSGETDLEATNPAMKTYMDSVKDLRSELEQKYKNKGLDKR